MFLHALRGVLQHLYDRYRLRRSPLLGALGLRLPEGADDLQRLIVAAIQALKPPASVSPHSSAWRIYRILSHRYVDEFSQREVAASLNLSLRQMRRMESLALRALADHLLANHALDLSRLQADAPEPAGDPTTDAEPGSDRQQELAWLERTCPSEPAELEPLVRSALQVLAPLTGGQGVQVDLNLQADLPLLAVQRTPVRQALLRLLTAAVAAAPGGRVSVAASAQGGRVVIRVLALSGNAPDTVPEAPADLSLARQLLALSGADLAVQLGEPGTPLSLLISLPSAAPAPLLVIDDNADTLELVRRTLDGSPYRFVGLREPAGALEKAARLQPRAILLDVMLPDIDGWELLGRLREHPQTSAIPVLVCSILPQERLALALGAAAFLPKPVSRQALLDALNRLPGREAPASSPGPQHNPAVGGP